MLPAKGRYSNITPATEQEINLQRILHFEPWILAYYCLHFQLSTNFVDYFPTVAVEDATYYSILLRYRNKVSIIYFLMNWFTLFLSLSFILKAHEEKEKRNRKNTCRKIDWDCYMSFPYHFRRNSPFPKNQIPEYLKFTLRNLVQFNSLQLSSDVCDSFNRMHLSLRARELHHIDGVCIL